MLKLRKEDWFHPDGFPIVVERREPQRPFGLHTHEFSEIVIITGGEGVHITGEDTYQLAAGDTFVIGGDRPHDYLNMNRLSLINILFDPSELPLELGDLQTLPGYQALFKLEPFWRKRHEFRSRLSLSAHDLIRATQLVEQLETELVKREPGFRVVSVSLWLQLAAFLSRCYGRSENESSRSLVQLAEVVSHLQRHYASSICLEELVTLSGMSRRTFLRLFESSFGAPPITYLIQLRLRRACESLRETSDSITDIAMRVGFSDSNYFSRKFRAEFGMSPRQYRSGFRRPADTKDLSL